MNMNKPENAPQTLDVIKCLKEVLESPGLTFSSNEKSYIKNVIFHHINTLQEIEQSISKEDNN